MTFDIRPIHVGKLLPPPYAGVEAHVDSLLRALAPEVQGTLVACGDPADAVRREHEFPYRLIVARLFGKVASVPIAPGVLAAVRNELTSGRCNLLHQHAPNPWGDLATLACSTDVPVVLSWHSDIVRQRQLMRVYRAVQRRVIDRADRIVVFTPKHYESSVQLRGPGVESKIVTIPMGLAFGRLDKSLESSSAAQRLDRFAAGRPLLLTVGRHIYYKGYEFLLSAMTLLRSDATLVMIGTGPLGASLRQQAVELGLQHRVLFMGEVDPPTLVAAMHRCDAFCLPSIEPSEAFGVASAEAMACGKPTIVCELGNGVNFLNRAGVTGLTVPPRDVAALADAIDTLVIDERLRARMGAEARAWVRTHFSVEAMRDGTLDMYRSLA
jgi:glycosyltransferase involved in cell wall biosynthesis